MTLFNPVMQKEKLAAIGLVIIIIGALSAYLLVVYGEDIFENLFGEAETDIETGDCVDVNYIGRYASNDTVFDSSYDDVESKTDGTPLNIFVTLDAEALPPEGYDDYSSSMIEGFMEGLIGLKEGDTSTIGPIPPEKAYGLKPKVGDVINLSSVIPDLGFDYVLKIVEVQEDAPMPSDYGYEDVYGNGTTTLYTLREDWHYIGEIIDAVYTFWDNSSVVTKLNETMLWMYTTPATDIGENFTYNEVDTETSSIFEYPTNSSSVTSFNDTHIIVTHSPAIGFTIEESMATQFGVISVGSYTVESLTADKINTSVTDSEGNKTYTEFDRATTIERNETQNITQPPFPGELLEDQLFSYLRLMISDFELSYNTLADETLYFEVTIEKVYKTSQG